MRRLISAIWHTLKEPRVITLIMVLVYVLILANGIFVLLHHTSWLALMYALFSVVGCAAAIPSAWRGLRWLEGPAVVLSGAGVLGNVLTDMYATTMLTSPHLLVSAFVLLMFTRVLRIWPEYYTSDSGKIAPKDLAKARSEVYRQLLQDELNNR